MTKRYPLAAAAALVVALTVPITAQYAIAQRSGSAAAADALPADGRHAIVIAGLGGGAEQTARFEGYLLETRRALVEGFGFSPDNVVVLGEQSVVGQPFVDDVALGENVRAAFADVAQRVRSTDHVYVILFGHGSTNGGRSYLNIPRRDLSDLDYADLLADIDASRIVVFNTASASAQFVETLSMEGRIIAAATRVPSQRNETRFPQYFVEALSSTATDADRNGDLSVLEVFQYAAGRTAQSFADEGLLPTENAILDDTGDAAGKRLEDLDGIAEGSLAAVTYLRSRSQELGAIAAALPDSVRGSVQARLARREELNADIATLKSRKASMDVDEYYGALEDLFVELARIENAIESASN